MSDPYRENAAPADVESAPKKRDRDDLAEDYFHRAGDTFDAPIAIAMAARGLRSVIYNAVETMVAALRAQEDNAEKRHREILAALGYDLVRDGDIATLNKINTHAERTVTK